MTWLTVKAFGRVKYFNISYVILVSVPIAAELYAAIYSHVMSLAIVLEFPLTWKLIYAASLCYAIAITIYQYFCPDIIKQFDDVEAYVTAYQPLFERAYPDRKYEIVLANLSEIQQDTRTELVRLHDKLSSAKPEQRSRCDQEFRALLDALYPACVQHFLVKAFENAKIDRELAMFTAGSLYVVGSLILGGLLLWKSATVFAV